MIPSVISQASQADWIAHNPDERNYNSGLLATDSEIFIATRWLNPENHRCEIVINRVDRVSRCDPASICGPQVTLRPTRIRILALPRRHGLEHFEDARLIRHAGKVFVAYSECHYYQVPFRSVQMLAELDADWNVVRSFTIEFGKNTISHEKNWQFFSHDGHLHFVYEISPAHVVVALDEQMRPLIRHEVPHSIVWPHGTMSGGTPPLDDGQGGYLSFFHSYVKEKPHDRRYSFSAYRFDKKTFAITGITDPLVVASEADPIIPNKLYPNWTPLVVFPCGAHRLPGGWAVSAGVNDSRDAIFWFTDAKLKFRAA